MLHRRRWIMVGTLVLVMMAFGSPRVHGQAVPTIQTTEQTVVAGDTISFSGTGFASGERVVTWATNPDQTVFSGPYVYASRADGSVEIAYNVPGDAANGRWAFTAYGDRSKAPAVTLFDVRNANPKDAEPPSTVAPPSGPIGTEFRFNVYGFKGSETVSYWITAPDGTIFAAYPSKKTADKNGKVGVAWVAPSDAARGTLVMTIQGLKSGRAKAVRFEIQ